MKYETAIVSGVVINSSYPYFNSSVYPTYSIPKYWRPFEQRADIYNVDFENRDVTVFAPRFSVEEK